MYEVYCCDWTGRDEEPEQVFATWDEANDYINEKMDYECSPDEGYMIHDVEADQWY